MRGSRSAFQFIRSYQRIMSARVVSICGLRDWGEGRRDDGVASGRSFYPTSLAGIHTLSTRRELHGDWKERGGLCIVLLLFSCSREGRGKSCRKMKVRGIYIWQAAKPL